MRIITGAIRYNPPIWRGLVIVVSLALFYAIIERQNMLYYNILRFFVSGLAIYGLFLLRKPLTRFNNRSNLSEAIRNKKLKDEKYYVAPISVKWKINSWRVIFFLILIIFNPIIPFSFHNDIWKIIDIVIIIIFAFSCFFLYTPDITYLCDNCGSILPSNNIVGYGDLSEIIMIIDRPDGCYMNYHITEDDEYIGEQLCFWCVKELYDSEKIHIHRKEPLIKKEQ